MKKINRKKIILTSGILLLILITVSVMAHGGNGRQKETGSCYGNEDCKMEKQENFGKKRGSHKQGIRQGQQSNFKGNKENQQNCDLDLDKIKNGEKYSLSKEEIEYIAHMREEEKIARDVYITLYKKWGIKTFDNIKNAEQRHMDLVKVLIDKYGLEDSMVDNTVGVFKTKEFQDLYNSLIEKGMKSEIEAIKVGLTIEDLDIYDLDRYLAQTDNQDIQNIFEKLNEGSFHHAQAYTRQLERYNGGDYKPQYLNQERWDEVLDSENVHGNEMMGKQQNNFKGMQGKLRMANEGVGERNINHNFRLSKVENNNQGFFSRLWNFLFGWI